MYKLNIYFKEKNEKIKSIILLFSLLTEDNQKIYLRGIVKNKGMGREWANIGWFFLFPLLFIKGEDGKIEAGSCQTLYTINDIVFNDNGR